MTQCTKIGCFAEKEQGDALFCHEDRVLWRNRMYKLGIAYNPYVEERIVIGLLDDFQNNR